MNATSLFLGPPATWAAAQLQLDDVQGLWGGRRVWLWGTGQVVWQAVARGMYEHRHRATLPLAQIHTLFEHCCAVDWVTLVLPQRPRLPDEACPTIRLCNSQGGTHSLSQPANDPHSAFEALYHAVLQLEPASTRGPCIYEGPFEWDYVPR